MENPPDSSRQLWGSSQGPFCGQLGQVALGSGGRSLLLITRLSHPSFLGSAIHEGDGWAEGPFLTPQEAYWPQAPRGCTSTAPQRGFVPPQRGSVPHREAWVLPW